MHLQPQLLCPLFTFAKPLLQQILVPWLEPNLEVLGLHRQTRRNRIRLEAIHNGLIPRILRRRELKRRNQPNKRSEQLSIREMRARTHARASAVAVVWGARAVGDVEVALWIEMVGVFKVLFVVICGIGIHVESCSCGDDGAVIFDGFDGDAGKADGDDGPVAEDFLDESGDVRDFLFV